MPEHMERRRAVYYIRRVIPKDLQPVIGRKERWLSLRTKDFEEAKRRLRIEGVRFDEWFSAERAKLTKAAHIVPANDDARPTAITDRWHLATVMNPPSSSGSKCRLRTIFRTTRIVGQKRLPRLKRAAALTVAWLIQQLNHGEKRARRKDLSTQFFTARPR